MANGYTPPADGNPGYVSAFDKNGNPISIPVPDNAGNNAGGRDNGTNPLAFLGPMMGMIGSILQNQQDSRSYSDAAYEATRRAEAGLFPLRKDPQKSANIDARRRAMRVNQGPSRKQVDRSRANLESYVNRKRQERANARAERAALARDIRDMASVPLQRDPAYQAYLDEMAANERDSLQYQASAKRDRAKAIAQQIIDDYNADIDKKSQTMDLMPSADRDVEYPGFAERITDPNMVPPNPTLEDLGYVRLGDASRKAHLDLYRSMGSARQSQAPAGPRDGGPYSDQLPDGGPYSTDLNPLAQLPNYQTGQTLADYDLQQTVPLQGPPSPPPPNYGTGQTLADYDIAMAKPYQTPDPYPGYALRPETLAPGASFQDVFPLPPMSLTPAQAAQMGSDIRSGLNYAEQYAIYDQEKDLEDRRAYTMGLHSLPNPRVGVNNLTPAQAQQMQLDIDRGRMMQRFNQSQPPYFLQANPLRSIPVPSTNYFGGVPMQIPMAPRPGMTLGGGY